MTWPPCNTQRHRSGCTCGSGRGPKLSKVLRNKLPEARLFSLNDPPRVSKGHEGTCRALGLDDYRLHDARHHWAVRQAKAGTPAEIIAAQLGHSDATMVIKVYGRFFPSAHDHDKWERIASAQDLVAV